MNNFCKFCGNQMDSNTSICSKCGKLNEVSTSIISNNKNEKKKKKNVITIVIVFIIILTLCFFNYQKLPKYSWNDENIIPKPTSIYGEITENSEDCFSIDVFKTKESDFYDYIESCKKNGFNIDIESTSNSYKSFNSDGYELNIYLNSDNEMSIDLKSPMKTKVIDWEKSNMLKSIPIPKSNIGNIYWENSNGFVVYVSNMTVEDYSSYVNECSEFGFNINYSKSENNYNAENDKGDKLKVSYEGGNIIFIRLDKNKKSDTSKKDNDQDSNKKNNNNNSVTPEFKSLMDSYENFFKEYYEFIDKYANSGYDSSFLNEYNNLLTKYNDYLQKLSSYNQDNLSTADYSYYLEVWSRILSMANN